MRAACVKILPGNCWSQIRESRRWITYWIEGPGPGVTSPPPAGRVREAEKLPRTVVMTNSSVGLRPSVPDLHQAPGAVRVKPLEEHLEVPPARKLAQQLYARRVAGPVYELEEPPDAPPAV